MQNLAAAIILQSGWRRALLALAAGSIGALALPPFNFPFACWLSFPVLVWLLDGAAASGRKGRLRLAGPAFLIGWLFGFGYFVAGLWWIGNALLVDAERDAWMLPLAIAGIPAVLAVFYGLAASLARLAWPDGLGRIFILSASFGLFEYLRATLFTGFPWNAIGYAAMPVPLLMQSASVVGLFGMNALAVLVFSAPALLGTGRHRVAGMLLAALLVATQAGYGYFAMSRPEPAAETLAVRIVQPSVDQSMKWDDTVRREIFDKLLQLSAKDGEAGFRPEVIVWPETALPFLLTENPSGLAEISSMLEPGQIVLTGAVRSEGTVAGEGQRYYNSILAIDSSGEVVGAADKIHLVPFGEYLPFRSLLEKTGMLPVAAGDLLYSPGQKRELLSAPSGKKLLPLICYEAIFPHEVATAGADALLNLTNDAWYGDTPGPYQHFRQAQLRAVEQGIPLVRAANNGISAFVDGKGRIIDAFRINAVGALDVALPLGKQSTIYSRYGMIIFPSILFIFFMLGIMLRLPRWARLG